MKLYESFGKQGFHTSIATSFGIDFEAYENVMLARFRGAGCHNNLLVVDANMLSLALESNAPPPVFAGRSYTVTPAVAPRVFHPKVVLQFGRSSARMFVSSANVTAPGLAGNLEVVGMVETDDFASGEAHLIAAGWRFVSQFLDTRLESVRRQIEWMLARTPWLREIESSGSIARLEDKTDAAFLTSIETAGIGEQFLGALAGQPVRRLILVSPYWDLDLSTLNLLLDRLEPKEACLLLDQGRHVFAAEAIAKRHHKRVKLLDFKAKGGTRFIHAKLMVAQTAKRDHVLYGSANCTAAALGGAAFVGSNVEACLYRALPAGSVLSQLGISDVLKKKPVPVRNFVSAERPEEIPLDDVAGRSPGQFVCNLDKLTWYPPPGADLENDRVEPLDRAGELLSIALRRESGRDDGCVQLRLLGKDRPAFARVVRSDGSVSAPAIVARIDELREEIRDARTRRIDAALADIDGETDLGLWLLETLNELEAAEASLVDHNVPQTRRNAARRTDSAQAAEERKLTYEQFMAGRRLRSEIDGPARNSLAGSYASHIRSFLNRLLGIRTEEESQPDDEANKHRAAFGRGDETDSAEDAVEGGGEFGGTLPDEQPIAEVDQQARALHLRRQNRDQLIRAVANLSKTVAEKASQNGLRSIDLLRLRAVLMIIASAGWSGVRPPRNSLQVLPAANDGEGTWPRLLGKVLFAYFGGRRNAIASLVLDDVDDEIPKDILECWATCIWVIQVTIVGVSRHHESQTIARVLQTLRATIYRVIALGVEELEGASVLGVLDALSNRFGPSLGIDSPSVLAAHRQTSRMLSGENALNASDRER
ncbi:hypothetical protein RFN25_07380 [Mesorhizobium abyssinicae]|uniref:hypothetical protein n=1 Tax=Mesorhizobium abyssinicae TaxID=1209958 RepID=UPI002A23D494|nr:hypothetical protein [Mesorhizobium abyssinicae]MDX8433254.1 hypothetical protein [Mesorhizobium abyssinicae]